MNNINKKFHDAILYGDKISKIKLLIEHGADVNSKNVHGSTALYSTFLPGSNSLKSFEIGKLLLEHGADPNLKSLMFGDVPLHNAVQFSNNNFKSVKLLIDHGADPNIQNKSRETPLYSAVQSDYYDNDKIVELLLDHGVKINIKNSFGETLLNVAVKKGKDYINVIKMLLDRGADSNIKNSHNLTALHIVSSRGIDDIDIMKVLLDHGANPNIKGGPRMNTPLHTAINLYNKSNEIFCFECIKLLIDHGSDLYVEDAYGVSPLDLINNEELRETIKEYADNASAFSVKQADVDDY